MRAVALAAAGLVMAASASAQRPPIQGTPLPPLQQQWQREGSPPVQQGPMSPNAPGPSGQGQVPAPFVAPPTVVERPNAWVPAGAVKLQALDKVNAQTAALTIKVGQSATFGSLTITVKSCLVRPTDQAADAAAFLDVTDSHPDSSGFDGWLLANEPSVSMMQHPIYDLRVTGCA
jgi:hypothetical protein